MCESSVPDLGLALHVVLHLMLTNYLLQLIVLLLPVLVLPRLDQCWSPVKVLVLELLQCCLPLLAVSPLEGAPALFASSSMFSVQA